MNFLSRNFINRLNVTSFANFNVNLIRLSCIQCCTQLANSSLIQRKTQNRVLLKSPATSTLDRRQISQYKIVYFKNSLINFFNKLLLIDKSKQNLAGYNWFRTLDQVNYNEFFTLLNLEDSYYSWYKVTELHVWMLLTRLMQNGDSLRVVRSSLIHAMWVDVEKRAKIVEPLNKQYKKNIEDIYERFKVSLILYDEGFLSDDKALANALWWHFFDGNCEDPRLIEALVSFVRHQINFLLLLNAEDEGFNEIKLKIWTPLKPHVESVK